MIVPNPATSRWVYALNYANSAEYRKADFKPWFLDKKVVGYGYKFFIKLFYFKDTRNQQETLNTELLAKLDI